VHVLLRTVPKPFVWNHPPPRSTRWSPMEAVCWWWWWVGKRREQISGWCKERDWCKEQAEWER
jgi:hypothetical protein